MLKKLGTGWFFLRKNNENKKISTSKRREIKCRKQYFYELKKQSRLTH